MFEYDSATSKLSAGLARLRAGGHCRTVGELVDLVGECQSVINQAAGLQMLAMAHLAAVEDVALEDGTVVEQHRGLGHKRLDAPALVSDQLGLTDAAASTRMGVAVDVVTRHPGVLEAMGEGRLDSYRAGIISEELREAPTDVCGEVVTAIKGSLGSEPGAALRRRVRRALATVDPELLRAKAARARAERSLCRWPGAEPGVDTWIGSFTTEQSRSGWAVVDGLARQYVREGKAGGLEQARADALMDLIHSRATGSFVVQLAVPARVLDGQTATLSPTPGTPAIEDAAVASSSAVADEFVSVVGFGMPGVTQVPRTWLASLAGSLTAQVANSASGPTAGAVEASTARPTGRARREVVACDPRTGALLSVSAGHDPPVRHPRDQRDRRPSRPAAGEFPSYRPPPALVALVKERDGRCRFPGCTVNARFCDIDHVTAWPAGSTCAANLMCLCRRHHRIKQTVRWRVRIGPDATVTWVDPTGRARTTLPVDFLQLDDVAASSMPAPQPQQLDPRVAEAPTDAQPEADASAHWSAWEDELLHDVSAAERAASRARRTARRRDPGWTTAGPADRGPAPGAVADLTVVLED